MPDSGFDVGRSRSTSPVADQHHMAHEQLTDGTQSGTSKVQILIDSESFIVRCEACQIWYLD